MAPRNADSRSRSVVIDLTADDDDDDFVQTRPTPNFKVSPASLPPIPLRPIRLELPPSASQDAIPPTKKRRVDEHDASTSPTSPQAPVPEQTRASIPPEQIANALGRCLETQVFPHIEAATRRLPTGVYDTDKLGANVIRKLVDKDFERHFHEGKGRLSSAAEGIAASRVHRIVTELISGSEYRLPPPPRSPSPVFFVPELPPPPPSQRATAAHTSPFTRSVLPSIETDDRSGQQEELSTAAANAKPPHRQQRRSISTKRAEKRGANVISPQKKPRLSVKKARIEKPRAVPAPAPAILSYQPATAPQRPYISSGLRHQISLAVANAVLPPTPDDGLPSSQLIHVDISDAEVLYLQYVARKLYGRPVVIGERSPLRDLRNVLKKMPDVKNRLVAAHLERYKDIGQPPPTSLLKRSADDIKNFFLDLYNKKINTSPVSLFVEQNESNSVESHDLSALLLTREIWGDRVGAARTYQNFRVSAKCQREDLLELRTEWTNCAGDIMTVTWLSDSEFVCGTTTHSDSHNQQYNKPGNLLLGCTTAASEILQAYPDHRIIRPVVSKGDNALDSMVASQDPWLFTSVVSSDYDPTCDLAFTSSFDHTVKVWHRQGQCDMAAVGTWLHGGRVNFVVASKNDAEPGVIATAADVPTEAVRVYHVDDLAVSDSPYDSYSCTRIHDDDYVPSEKWAYYPAAIRWGVAPNARHLLLVGYSPRSRTGDDHDIPEDKLKTGELCLWDTIKKTQVSVTSAKTQNIFEVAWHPTRAAFAAASSAVNKTEKTDQSAKTQIRIFEFNNGSYGAIKTLDCAAIDINEISIMPNSLNYSYITASCTDGNVYVWDSAGIDLPMCTLEHGEPVEELLGERDQEDVGVKFTAWGSTADRIYTGSSDGVLKVWNIRQGGVLVKDVMEAAAPITFGCFSPNCEKLIIGDGSGRVYLLALKDPEDEEPREIPVAAPAPASAPAGPLAGRPTGLLDLQLPNGKKRTVRRPLPFTPHADLPPPAFNGAMNLDPALEEGQEKAREFLKTSQLVLHPNRTIGAVQGVNYASTGLFRAEAHVNGDPNEPVLFHFDLETKQRRSQITNLSITRIPRQTPRFKSSLTGNSTMATKWPKFDKNDITNHVNDRALLGLINEKAELDDSLVISDYETSILDSSESDNDNENGWL